MSSITSIHFGFIQKLVYAAIFMLFMFISVSTGVQAQLSTDQSSGPSLQSCFDMVNDKSVVKTTKDVEPCCNFVKIANVGRSQQTAAQKKESSGHLCYALIQEASKSGSDEKQLAEEIISECGNDFSTLLEDTSCSNSQSIEVPDQSSGPGLQNCFDMVNDKSPIKTLKDVEPCCNFVKIANAGRSQQTVAQKKESSGHLCDALIQKANENGLGAKQLAEEIIGECGNDFSTLLEDTRCSNSPSKEVSEPVTPSLDSCFQMIVIGDFVKDINNQYRRPCCKFIHNEEDERLKQTDLKKQESAQNLCNNLKKVAKPGNNVKDFVNNIGKKCSVISDLLENTECV